MTYKDLVEAESLMSKIRCCLFAAAGASTKEAKNEARKQMRKAKTQLEEYIAPMANEIRILRRALLRVRGEAEMGKIDCDARNDPPEVSSGYRSIIEIIKETLKEEDE